MGKITRLNDPANPYGKQKVPTGRAADKPKAARPAAAVKKVAATPAKKGLIPTLNDKYGGGARKRRIDAAIEGKKS